MIPDTINKRTAQRLSENMKRSLGFTLLELMVVMSLLAVLTVAVVPLYGNSMAYVTLRSTRNDFASLLSFVQEKAVSESREYRVYIDNKEGKYWVMRFKERDKEDKIFEKVEAEFGQERFFPPNIKLERIKAPKDRHERAFYIGCYPNGASDRAKLNFRDLRGKRRAFSIEVLGAMGKVDVKTGVQRVVE